MLEASAGPAHVTRYAKTKVRVLLGEKLDPERPYHTSVDDGKVVTLVR